MKKLKLTDYIIYTVIIACIIALDQITKALAVKFLDPIDTYPLIKDVLHLTYAENKGAAFGILADARWVFMSISIIAIGALMFGLYAGFMKGGITLTTISVCLISAGGIGNMIDRIALEYVVDFIELRFIDFAIFNVADCAVCIGAGMLFLAVLLDIIKEAREKKNEENEKNG